MASQQIKVVPASGLLALSATVATADPGIVSYGDDALGRMTRVCDAEPNSGQRTISLDAADNRSQATSARVDMKLLADQALYSSNGAYQLRMQTDGNLVLYRQSGSTLVPMGWATNTVGSGAARAYFQSDGNLVLYTAAGVPVCPSNTYAYHCASLDVQDNGNVTITSADGAVVWQTGTGT